MGAHLIHSLLLLLFPIVLIAHIVRGIAKKSRSKGTAESMKESEGAERRSRISHPELDFLMELDRRSTLTGWSLTTVRVEGSSVVAETIHDDVPTTCSVKATNNDIPRLLRIMHGNLSKFADRIACSARTSSGFRITPVPSAATAVAADPGNAVCLKSYRSHPDFGWNEIARAV